MLVVLRDAALVHQALREGIRGRTQVEPRESFGIGNT